MKFIKAFGFLGLIFFVFSTKITIGQVHFIVHPSVDYPLFGKNYENDLKQINKIILIEPNPTVTFSGFRAERVSLKRITRVERRIRQIIKGPIIRIIGTVTPVINYKPDSTTKVQLQEFLKKLTENLDSIETQQDFFKKNKINYSLPFALDSIKETNYIFLTYYIGDIRTGPGFSKSVGSFSRGIAYTLLVNKKDKTVCYLNKIIMSPYRNGNIPSLLCQSLKKIKNDIEKNCQNKRE